MEVILLEKIRNLGELGAQVNVKSGYARNYLFPYSKAIPATEANKAKFEARRAGLEKHQTETLAAAQGRAALIQGVTLEITRKVAAEGKLYGSVGTNDIVEAMKQQGCDLNKSEIEMPQGALKDIGEHEIGVSLHSEVSFKITVKVIGEE